MRLDHLLSTEFFFRTPVWRPSCGPRAGDGSRFRRGRAGVEEIMGFWIPFGGPGSGMGMLLGSRTATRIRFGCVRFSGCPWRDAVGLWACGSGPVGARGGLRTG